MSKKDIAWREYNIHDNDVEEEQEHTDCNFDLFAPKHDEDAYETYAYCFPNLLSKAKNTITLRGQKEYDNSTGMSVWKGSEILCNYLLQNADLVHERRVLELGAGVGLCGIAARHLGASCVRLTDGDTNVLENLRHNVARNTEQGDATISCPQLIWGSCNAIEFEKDYGRQDVILASDCVYMTKSLKPLFETIHQLLEPKDGLLLYVNSCASQCPIDAVVDTASDFGFASTGIWSKSSDDVDPVYSFRRKLS